MSAAAPISRRCYLPASGSLADANCKIRHPAERGSWIWAAEKAPLETAILRFRLRVDLDQPLTIRLHVTADQRFQLRCNGQRLTFGPDRCDLEHWTVHSLDLDLPAGKHDLEALAWSIAQPREGDTAAAAPPMAQMTWQGGFLLFAEGAAGPHFNTGEAPWVVDDLTECLSFSRQNVPGYHDIGPAFHYDLADWFGQAGTQPTAIRPALEDTPHGVRRPGWCLYPASLAEQRAEPWTGGIIRAVRSKWKETPYLSQDTTSPELPVWRALLTGGSITIPPHSQREIIWDFETYCCGYPVMHAAGSGATIEWTWAEALYAEKDSRDVTAASHKHHRGEIENKVFVGLSDSWQLGDAVLPAPPALWWRCGRYVRLRIQTEVQPLTLSSLGVSITGYPLDSVGAWSSSDAGWDSLIPLFQRAFRCAAHETWTDTPYYEQMCYVGDNLICALSNYAWFGDSRLSRRSIELYEWSRRASGFVAERYPSRLRQESSTFSLLWPCMVRDFAWWNEDRDFVRKLLPGLRSVLAEFEGLAVDGLLRQVPGWPFIDWSPEWSEGCGPGVREGDSSIVNLHWVLALQAAAQVESAVGDDTLATRCDRLARRVFTAVLERYWDPARGLLKDTTSSEAACEYVQAFALRTGLLDAEKTQSCLTALKHDPTLIRATIYGSFYLLEALYRHGESEEFHRRLQPWRDLPGRGFTSTPEQNEPSRSDAHPWGAHPAWHTLASVAGVRPSAAGFSRVQVTPCPGPLESIDCVVNHPRGVVKVSLKFTASTARGLIDLPPTISGDFDWQGRSYPLQPGPNQISAS